MLHLTLSASDIYRYYFQMKHKGTFIALLGIALLGGITFLWLSPNGLTQAPTVALKTIKGKTLSLESLRGRPVLVNFWATTCPGCVKEMPHLSELYAALAPAGLEIIGIAMAYDPPNHVLALTTARKIPYTIALDLDGSAAHAFGQVRQTPTSFLIDPDGQIVHQKVGKMDMGKLHRMIEKMLPKTASLDLEG